MRWSGITAILNTILPRHARAERAVRVREAELQARFAPQIHPKYTWIHTLFPYRDELVRALIQAVKYYGEKELVARLAPYAADYCTDLIHDSTRLQGWEQVRIAPIPSSRSRFRERGYNQAALFARAIAARVPDATYTETLLTRLDRVSQVHVPRTKRAQNMDGVFTASHHAAGACVILIDDVVESGATLADARRALLDEGAKDVIAVAIAH